MPMKMAKAKQQNKDRNAEPDVVERPLWGPRRLSPSSLIQAIGYVAAAYKDAAAAADLLRHNHGPFARWLSKKKLPQKVPRTSYLRIESDDGLAWLKRLVDLQEQATRERLTDPFGIEARKTARRAPGPLRIKPQRSVMLDWYFCILLWGTRLAETAQLRWENVDFKRGFVTFPRDTTKTQRELVLPMTPWVRQVLEERRRANHLWRPGSPWVFPSEKRAGRCVSFGYGMVDELEQEIGLRVNAHDLRRTLATKYGAKINLERLGRLIIVGAALNHVRGSNVTNDYIQEQADLIRGYHEKWENRIRQCLNRAPFPSDQPEQELDDLLTELYANPKRERAVFDEIAKHRGWALSPAQQPAQ